MKLPYAINNFNTILENGPLGTRLKYDYGISSMEDLLSQGSGEIALGEIYEGDLSIAKKYQLPIILNAATYRASRNHLKSTDRSARIDIKNVNYQLIKAVNNVQKKQENSNYPIIIGAPIGSMGDAYSPNNAPTIEESVDYHSEQINIFRELDIDFINVVTIPSLPEAIGIALAAEKSNIDYTMGFVLNEQANLLDNTKLNDAIDIIDKMTHKKPLGYLITCTHASRITLLPPLNERSSRLIGIQPNGSNLTTNQLEKSKIAQSDTPEIFAVDLMNLKNSLDLKIIGGCCGTTRSHLQCLAKTITPGQPMKRNKP